MPTDLQIIDGFEALRSSFMGSNPQGFAFAPDRANGTRASEPVENSELSEDEILFAVSAAWCRTHLSICGRSAAELRWVDTLSSSVILDGGCGAVSSADLGLQTTLRRCPDFESMAAEASSAFDSQREAITILHAKGASRGPTREVMAWAKLLPGLRGLKGWQFLAHIGRDVVPPMPGYRKFFWRLGTLPRFDRYGPKSAAKFHSEAERVRRMTGLSTREMTALLRWHTGDAPGLADGNRCGRRPDCEGCAFAHSCSWKRYQPRAGGGAGAGGSGLARPADEGDALPGLGGSAGARKKIIERWERSGPESLHDAELLGLILSTGQDWQQSLDSAERLLHRLGGLRGIEGAAADELKRMPGVGDAKAMALRAAFELGRRTQFDPLTRGDPVTGSEDVWEAYRDRYSHIPQEHFIVLLLDRKNRLIRTHLVSKGTLDGSLVHPREVFKEAIRESAASLIVMHNHPSGDPDPSPQDVAVTSQLAEAGEILGIRLVDHIILGSTGYYSFKDNDEL